MRKNNKKGFTIVELVIVIAVIAILAGVLIPTFAGVVTKANESKALQEATAIYKEAMALDLADGKQDYKDNNAAIKVGARTQAADGTDLSDTNFTYSDTAFSCKIDDYTVTFNGTTWTVN